MDSLDAVNTWIDGKITTGKMISVHEIQSGVPRDLVGLIANAYEERIRRLLLHLKDKRDICQGWADKHKAEYEYADYGAEITKVASYNETIFKIMEMFPSVTMPTPPKPE